MAYREGHRGVVKLLCEGASPKYAMPWQISAQESWSGSGFFVKSASGEVLVLTNAHVVDNAFVVRVALERAGGSRKYATVVCMAPDVDLALLRVANCAVDDSDILTIASSSPSLFSSVATLGFPQGGSTVCITKGVVSRIDAQLYAVLLDLGFSSHFSCSPSKLLILQIDAAINPGNSGGPALSADGSVVGVASSNIDEAQNIGYIIPTCVVEMFLAEYAHSGRWGGLCELGFAFRKLECEALRDYMGVVDDKGILVTSVAPLGPLHSVLLQNDVLLTVDGMSIHSDATIAFEYADKAMVQLPFEHLFSRKRPGQPIVMEVLRAANVVKLSAEAATLPPLLPRYNALDAQPSFAIFGGLVFSRLSMPLYREIEEDGLHSADRYMLMAEGSKWKETNEQEVVVLLSILRHRLNEGINPSNALRIVSHINDVAIVNLKSLVSEVLSAIFQNPAGEQFVRIRFRTEKLHGVSNVTYEEVLTISHVVEADSEILLQNQIAAPVSQDLAQVYRQYAPRDNATVQAWVACMLGGDERCEPTCKRFCA